MSYSVKLLIVALFTMNMLLMAGAVEESQLKKTCISIDKQSFNVEVAETPQQKERGLKFREYLAENKGMIFPFETPRFLAFWMKDCKISLDLLFFRESVLVDYQDSAAPCRKEPCPLYRSKVPADLVVELKAGSRQKYRFTPGQSHFSACP